MPKMAFTEKSVQSLPFPKETDRPREVQYFERQKRGLSLVLYVSYGETKTWRALFYNGQKAQTKRLGSYPAMKVAEARKAAEKFDPDRAIASKNAGTFKDVAEEWLIEYVEKKKLRSKKEIERRLAAYVYPKWAKRRIFDIDKDIVRKLLAEIERDHGAPQADAVLATIRSIMKWYDANGPQAYSCPIVTGMNRDLRTTRDRARERILTDDEIRAVWKACGDLGSYGALVKMLLLTGQRLRKVSMMRWPDIEDGVWTIPKEPREKGNAVMIKLPQLALDILADQPRLAGNPFVFPGSPKGRVWKRADHPKSSGPPAFNSFSQHKTELDALLPKGTPRWVLHDLRRTARSRMSQLRVDQLVAELTLGHAIRGIAGIYDRYSYFEEKSEALRRLADHIAAIIENRPASNVVPLHPQQAAS